MNVSPASNRRMMSPLELRSSLWLMVVDMPPVSHLVLRPSSLAVHLIQSRARLGCTRFGSPGIFGVFTG